MASDVFALGKILHELCEAWQLAARCDKLPEDVGPILARMQHEQAAERPDATSLLGAFGLSNTLFGAQGVQYEADEAGRKQQSGFGVAHACMRARVDRQKTKHTHAQCSQIVAP